MDGSGDSRAISTVSAKRSEIGVQGFARIDRRHVPGVDIVPGKSGGSPGQAVRNYAMPKRGRHVGVC